MANAPELKRRTEGETWDVELFDLELDEAARAELAADAPAVVRKAIESTGIPIDSLTIDDKMLKPDGGTGGGTRVAFGPIVAHVVRPANRKSKWITVVFGATDEGEREVE